MTSDPGAVTGEVPVPSRTDRRRLQTRAALIGAAQELIAEGRPNVAVSEITRRADVGLGSFYNHFETKEQLYEAALQDALEQLGAFLDSYNADHEDPAAAFARSFRVTGRLFRVFPQLSRVLLRGGGDLIYTEVGLAPRARRDIAAAAEQGRFTVDDVGLAVTMAAGAMIGLGTLLEREPERDDARSVDALTRRLLRAFGMTDGEADALCRLPLPDPAGFSTEPGT